MPALTSIGATIADRRRGLNLTQQTLSDLSGVSRSTVQALEYGSGSIRLEALTAVAEVLGLHIGVLRPGQAR
ncbi:helix-turn-helix domain-containing protein [Gordonia sp. (in: high G+C Gram-positive bacteria)]|uniref:helix-turn-helix domain-containing protein n=1 Tax=Gordonia sp. (in: high G+C Gram-positive bacteria) TaxID=84139 RepID=UPI003FA5ED20